MSGLVGRYVSVGWPTFQLRWLGYPGTMGLSDFFSTLLPTVYAEEEEIAVDVVEVSPAEEEEEEEEEPEDPKDAIMEECAKECPSLKHHLDECNERVENGSSENCIEEFFHFMHCADECAAPKIFAATK